MFDQVCFVLVAPSHPGNIGASARALKTMGFKRLELVRPKHYPCAEATARAAGADDILAAAQVVPSLADAVSSCSLVIGATARRRALQCPVLGPRQLAELLAARTAHPRSAIVFGREHAGLPNEELDRCHYAVSIPANPAYSSLNLAAAVQIIGYELRAFAESVRPLPEPEWGPAVEPATAEDLDRYIEHLYRALVHVGFIDPARPGQVMRRLRILFNRAAVNKTELKLLRGWLTATLKLKRDRTAA